MENDHSQTESLDSKKTKSTFFIHKIFKWIPLGITSRDILILHILFIVIHANFLKLLMRTNVKMRKCDSKEKRIMTNIFRAIENILRKEFNSFKFHIKIK